MKSHITKSFRKYFANLPKDIQGHAKKSYRLWRKDPFHTSLQFKQISQRQVIYSVRINLGYRALGLIEKDEIYWFWIGPHGDYDNLLKRL
ncbi:MAG: hypothetical protein KC422_09375 [Trueperaceae bacterium]|nr:hypothetical protein [Trueperaceae bacterium]